MRRPRMWFCWRALALTVGVSLLAWGMGTSATEAQMHHGGHGGHGGHDTTVTTGPGTTTTTPALQPGEQEREILYGPYTFQAAPPSSGDQHNHWHSGNQFSFLIQKPCDNCYITGMQARLVGPDRTSTVGHTPGGALLHHMVLFNTDFDKTDATCEWGIPFPLGGLFGQRFFASGDERTPIYFPPGYGYRVGTGSWTLIWEGAHSETTPKQIYYAVKYRFMPASANLKNVEPIWFDVAQCGFSTFAAPAGPSTKSWTWTVNRPGAILGAGGHLHDGGVNLVMRNDSTGRVLCDSRAGYGETPLYVDSHGGRHLSSMSICGGPGYNPIDTVTNGQRITITGHYDMPQAVNDQMGIAIAYIGEPSAGGGGGGGGSGGACVTATNTEHVQAGRATTSLFWAWARGSNAYIGATWETTSLREGPTGTWTRVTAC
jgi:Stress up-regulated Nod 19